MVTRLLDEVRSWDEVVIHERPAKGRGSGYFRATRLPRKHGAFLYVYPTRLRCQYRLDLPSVEGHEFATRRAVKEGNPYGVMLRPLNAQSYDEAVKLARLAYDRSA